ncbi:MAG: hypothetical protein GY743_23410 [Planctomycetaceae bacterium]|nr:hypothetical protein [Planctomycetaceae bacterium]
MFWYWGSGNLTKTKVRKQSASAARTLTINSVNGSQKMRTFEYQPRNVSRETWGETLRRWFGKDDGPMLRQSTMAKPQVLNDFIFYVKGEELLEDDVRRFLRAAWNNRQRGVGLSARHWVREWRNRPQWFRDLGPQWYYSLLALLQEGENITERQLVRIVGHQQCALKFDPHTTLAILKWAQAQKGNEPQEKAAEEGPVSDLGDITISFDRGESSFEG